MKNETLLFFFILVILPIILQAQTPLKEIRLVGDIDHVMPSSMNDIYSSDDSILAFDVLNSTTIVQSNDLGLLPHAEIDGYHAADDCDLEIYSLDTSTEISSVVMRGADVFKMDGTKILDANAEAIPYGVNVDAISRHPDDCDLIFSINTIAEMDGSVYFPSDLIRYNEIDGFSLLHRFGFTQNIDAIHMLEASVVLLSLDITAEINDTVVFDDDVFEYDLLSDSMVINFSPETFNPSWQSADVNAVWAKPLQVGTLQWQLNSTSVPENVGTFNLTINRTEGSDGDIIVSFFSEDGVAVSNEDFVAVDNSITILEGQSFAVLEITIIDDNMIEGSEDFTVSITDATGGAHIGAFSEIEIVITDNDDLIFKNDFEN